MGPAQLLMRVSAPTAKTLKPLMPLYALERSTEEIALEPPKAKKVVYWRTMEVAVISAMERVVDWRVWRMMLERRKRGMFVARDWVIARRVHRWWTSSTDLVAVLVESAYEFWKGVNVRIGDLPDDWEARGPPVFARYMANP